MPAELSLRRDFFGGAETSLELTAKVIRDGKHGDIISQYVGFTRVFDEQVKEYGRTDKAIIETIRICRDKALLSEFLADHEKEAYNAMQLFTEEFIESAIRKEAHEEGKLEGRLEGRLEGMFDTLFGLVRGGYLNADIASTQAGLTLAAFNAKMAEYEARPQA